MLVGQGSHPSWVCGLKQGTVGEATSHARSHPSWVCGLKLENGYSIECADKSHPSWVCGLKQGKTYRWVQEQLVTPFVGVWIETLTLVEGWGFEPSHPSWVCGLKHIACVVLLVVLCHTLRGCVD